MLIFLKKVRYLKDFVYICIKYRQDKNAYMPYKPHKVA